MKNGGRELAEGGDGFAGAEDVSEEARRGGTGVLEDLGEEIEGGSADAVDGDVTGEESAVKSERECARARKSSEERARGRCMASLR